MATEHEQLIKALNKLGIELATLQTTLAGNMASVEKRLETLERQIAQIGSGLALVLNRSQANKKKAIDWRHGFNAGLLAALNDMRYTKNE